MPSIPPPNVVQVPISVGLRLPLQFHDFVHEEEVLGREEWKIDLGNAQAEFYTQLFGYLFEDLIMLNPEQDARGLGFDALIEPSVEAFEFSVPNQTKTDSFAVWIRYRLNVYDRNGILVANWPVSAYGKSLTTAMGGSDALERAAILAMRDAAALMIIKFTEDPLIASLGDPATVLPAIDTDEDEESAAPDPTLGGGLRNE